MPAAGAGHALRRQVLWLNLKRDNGNAANTEQGLQLFFCRYEFLAFRPPGCRDMDGVARAQAILAGNLPQLLRRGTEAREASAGSAKGELHIIIIEQAQSEHHATFQRWSQGTKGKFGEQVQWPTTNAAA
jgi:hypothetical protein